MKVPPYVREVVQNELWRRADELVWTHLSSPEKSAHYEAWTREPAIGGVLSHYMDQGRVRVYIKDTLLKPYTREQLSRDSLPLTALGINASAVIVERYVKPHGRRFADGRVVAWGRADDWKLTLTTLYERVRAAQGAVAHGVVLTGASGRWAEPAVRALVKEVATRLGLGIVVWLQ